MSHTQTPARAHGAKPDVPPQGATRPRRSAQVVAETRAGYLFLLPNFVGFCCFALVPIGASVVLTFTHWNLTSPPTFAGVDNYTRLAGDPLFWKTLRNSAYYTVVAVPTAVFVAFWLALLLNRGFRGVTFFRTIFFLPYVTLTVAVAIVWQWLYNPDVGLVNTLLAVMGVDGPSWLQDSGWAMPAVILMSNWQGVGYPMLILLAALQGVPEEYYESARLDGAGWLQRIRYITLPTIAPATFYIFVVSLIGAMQGFDQFYVLTQGGPSYATTTIVMYIYQQGFQFLDMGYAATMAVALFIVISALTAIVWKLNSRTDAEPAR